MCRDREDRNQGIKESRKEGRKEEGRGNRIIGGNRNNWGDERKEGRGRNEQKKGRKGGKEGQKEGTEGKMGRGTGSKRTSPSLFGPRHTSRSFLDTTVAVKVAVEMVAVVMVVVMVVSSGGDC